VPDPATARDDQDNLHAEVSFEDLAVPAQPKSEGRSSSADDKALYSEHAVEGSKSWLRFQKTTGAPAAEQASKHKGHSHGHRRHDSGSEYSSHAAPHRHTQAGEPMLRRITESRKKDRSDANGPSSLIALAYASDWSSLTQGGSR
jgi:hypothetical protein